MKATWIKGENPKKLAKAERNKRDEEALGDPSVWVVNGEGMFDAFSDCFPDSKIFVLGETLDKAALPLSDRIVAKSAVLAMPKEMTEGVLLGEVEKLESFWETKAKEADPFKNILMVCGGTTEERSWWCSKLAHKTSVPVLEGGAGNDGSVRVLALTTKVSGAYYRAMSQESDEEAVMALTEELRYEWPALPGERIWQGGMDPEPGCIDKRDWERLVGGSTLDALGGKGCIFIMVGP